MSQPKTGVLLINLGTPDAPTAQALRRYLAEFLWDRRVVDLPRPLWWLILHGIILRTRPAKSAAAYKSVWREGGSPLLVISRQQQQKLQALLDEKAAGRYHVALGMRYGNPSIASALEELRNRDVEELIVLPLYPQNSCSTTGSSFDALAMAMQQHRFVPPQRFIADYHDHPLYIKALAETVRGAWQQHPQPDRLVISFHGTPRRFRDEGDLYYEQCQATARLLAAELGLADGQWLVSFQSRFGKEEWLKPYTDVTLQELPEQEVKSVDVICPGFSADCLETLEEIAKENRDYFLHSGGEQFHYIPALNAGQSHIELFAELIAQPSI
jgi:ferrochelatase